MRGQQNSERVLVHSHCSSATVQIILISMNFTFLSAIMGIGLPYWVGLLGISDAIVDMSKHLHKKENIHRLNNAPAYFLHPF